MKENEQINVLAAFPVRIGLEYGKKCKNNDHTSLFHCINTCRVPDEMLEHSAYQPCVQTASSGHGKCFCMKNNVCIDRHDVCVFAIKNVDFGDRKRSFVDLWIILS